MKALPLSARFPHCPGRAHLLAALCALGTLSLPVRAQDATPPAGQPPAAAPEAADGSGARPRRNAFSPEAALAALRESMKVTDDAEWGLISDRIKVVYDLRRSMGGFGTAGMRGFGGAAAGSGARTYRQFAGSSPEAEALRSALTDNLPDAEIKARLQHLRDVRKQTEARLDKAREDLRSILTVRQEAILVMLGLLN